MKKLLTLLLAGAFVFSAAASVDAGTAVKQQATVTNTTANPMIINATKVTTNTTYKTVNNTNYVTNYSSITHPQVNFPSHYARGTTSYWSYWTTQSSYSIYSTSVKTRLDLGETTYTYSSDVSSTGIKYKLVDGVLVAYVDNTLQTTQDSARTDEKTVTTTNTTTNVTTVVSHSQFHYDNDPLVLDIYDTNKITAAKNEWQPHAPAFYGEYASAFDFTGDGIADNCEWMSDNPDAFLCMPVKGEINGVTELFGNLGGYANGFDKLSTLCDTDGSGVVEGSELDGLMLWIDANRNGLSDPGELHTLAEYGVAKIYTAQSDFVGKYETVNGETKTMWAWWPTVQQ